MSLQAVSKHLKVLERAGLVSRGRQAQYRPVRLEPEGFGPAARWLTEHRAMRLAQLDRIERTIHALRPSPSGHETSPDVDPPDPSSTRRSP